MPPKRSVGITAAWIGIIGVLIIAIATIAVPFIEKLLNNPSEEIEYVGRVIDNTNQLPIAGAKVTLDLQGVPPVVYTDSEGVYRFNVVIDSDISGQVRVDAQGYQVYTRNISLSPYRTIIEDIRLTPHSSSISPAETEALSPPFDPTLEETGQIAIVDAQPSSGSKAPPDSSACLWTEASGQGASLVLTLERESTIHSLRVALNQPFVKKIRLTFSDNSQQTVDLIEIRDYEYQNVDLKPLRTLRITVEVLEVQDNSFDSFGICHIEVFGTKSSTVDTPSSPLIEIFPQVGAGEEYTFQDQIFSREFVTNGYCTHSAPSGLQFNYNMRIPEDFGGWGIQWETSSTKYFDASAFTTFVFWVRGVSGGETLQVVLLDTNDVNQSVKIHELAPITTDWTKISVPLSLFSAVNLASIDHIDFAFYGRDGTGSICIDDIRFLP